MYYFNKKLIIHLCLAFNLVLLGQSLFAGEAKLGSETRIQNPQIFSEFTDQDGKSSVEETLRSLEEQRTVHKRQDIEDQRLIPGENSLLYRARFRSYKILARATAVETFKKMHLIEHKKSAGLEWEITKLRTYTFIAIHGSSLLAWSFSSMDWNAKMAAIALSTVGNLFFIYYENILDEKLYDVDFSKAMIRIPLKAYHKVLRMVKKADYRQMRKTTKRIKNWGDGAGRFLMMSLINGAFIYTYQYIGANVDSFLSGKVFLDSIEPLLYYMGTGVIYSLPRGNLKKFGRNILSEIEIHRLSLVLNLGIGLSFVALVTEALPAPMVLGVFGGSGLVFSYLTSESKIQQTIRLLRRYRLLSCKAAF